MSPATEESKKRVSIPTLLSLSWNSVLREKRIGSATIIPILLVPFAIDFIDPRMRRGGIVFSLTYVSIWLVLFLWVFAIQMTRQATIQLALEGLYEDALRLNRYFFWLPSYGRSLKCWILLEAGRYSDLLATTKPRAFDRCGQPKVTSSQLYYHAMALSYQGQGERAQELFEAAYRLVPEAGYVHDGLADCLLEQNKDPEHARALFDGESEMAGVNRSQSKDCGPGP
jgi:hypothetical protein